MDYNSIYVYGIIDGKFNKELAAPGIGNREDKVYCVSFKDVTAVISYTPFEEYDPTEENTLAHEKIIQEVLQEGLTIAPMRFCTVLKGENNFRKLLHSGYLAFKRNILKIRNKQEYSVKVFLEIEKLKAEINGGDELVKQSKEMAEELYGKLKLITNDNVLEEQITEEMILNATFLVRKDKIAGFYDEINKFDQKFSDKLKIRISGPTAPYNFVEMPTK